MYNFMKIRHDIIKQCHRNYKEMRKINNNLKIEIFRKIHTKKFGCPEGFFLGFGCPKRYPDALLAKTMAMIILGQIRIRLQLSFYQFPAKPLNS